MSLEEFIEFVAQVNKDNGWTAPTKEVFYNEAKKGQITTNLVNIHDEVSEAFGAFKDRNVAAYRVELADIIIRGIHALDAMSDSAEEAARILRDKMYLNASRGYRHGGKIV